MCSLFHQHFCGSLAAGHDIDAGSETEGGFAGSYIAADECTLHIIDVDNAFYAFHRHIFHACGIGTDIRSAVSLVPSLA